MVYVCIMPPNYHPLLNSAQEEKPVSHWRAALWSFLYTLLHEGQSALLRHPRRRHVLGSWEDSKELVPAPACLACALSHIVLTVLLEESCVIWDGQVAIISHCLNKGYLRDLFLWIQYEDDILILILIEWRKLQSRMDDPTRISIPAHITAILPTPKSLFHQLTWMFGIQTYAPWTEKFARCNLGLNT